MSRFRFSNHASALITATVSSTATSVQLEAGGGAKMPVLGGGDRFTATLIAPSGVREIVVASAVVGDVVTIARGQEGTAAQTFSSGSRFEVRMTAGMADNFLQRAGDSMGGTLDMGGNAIVNAIFPGAIKINSLHTYVIRSMDIDPSTPYAITELGSIAIPLAASGQRPSYHGRVIVNTEMFDGIVFDAFIDVNHVPSWFKLCDGTNGTPDLRGRFIRGWTAAFGVGGHGTRNLYQDSDPGPPPSPADEFVQTDAQGNHAHGGGTAGAALTAVHLPGHSVDTTRVAMPAGSGNSAVGTINSVTHTGTGASHGHGIGVDGNHQHVVYNLPPFYVLAKVMFNL